MEDWETTQEIVKVDISRLKDQVGQILEALKSLKASREALIQSRWLKFQEDKPNIKANPLSRHDNALINVIDLEGHQLVKNVSEIQSS